MKFKISTLEEWEEVAEYVATHLSKPILLLDGNLGAGKTTFTQVLLNYSGSKDEVNSPTYSIVNEYDSPKGKIYHFDLYRIEQIEELYDIGFYEYLNDAYLCIIEWADIIKAELDEEEYHQLNIILEDTQRIISFK